MSVTRHRYAEQRLGCNVMDEEMHGPLCLLGFLVTKISQECNILWTSIPRSIMPLGMSVVNMFQYSLLEHVGLITNTLL